MTTVVVRPNRVVINTGGAVGVTLRDNVVQRINTHRGSTSVITRNSTVAPTRRDNRVTIGGVAGMRGPQGEPGDGTFTMLAGASAISALRVVIAEDGVARYPDISAPIDAGRVVGVSFTAAAAGGVLTVQSDGVVNEPSWTWTPGPVWCGLNGVLTQTMPASPAWLMEVGRARSATSLVLDIQKPIIRA